MDICDVSGVLSKKCRACLSENQDSFSLFDIYENDITLADILQNCLSTKVFPDDIYPSNLCSSCTTTLVQFYNFALVYQMSLNKVKDLVEGKLSLDTSTFIHNKAMVESECTESQICNKNEPNPIQYQCEECGNLFGTLILIQNHMHEEHVEQTVEFVNTEAYEQINTKVTCKVCRDSFKNYKLLKEHYESKHKQIYMCEECGKTFRKRAYLKEHQEVHSIIKPHKCSYCPKSFKGRTVWFKHEKLHTHPKSSMCEICGKSFNEIGTLKTHIKLLHVKERNYVCQICNLAFPLKSTLQKHVRRHKKSEKTFNCQQCNMKYYDKTSLNRHVLFKHNDQDVRYNCKYCDKMYSSSANLSKHIIKNHKT